MAVKRPFRVLAIDGGGIRGIIPARLLEEIEKRTGKPIAEQFDLICGTSTGGIIAAALTKPDPEKPGRPQYSARDVGKLYEDHGHKIFPRTFWNRIRQIFAERYSDRPLNQVLDRYFGKARLSDSLTSVMVSAYDPEKKTPVFMKHRKNYSRGGKDLDFLMRDVARATSAAPTYFEPALIDSLPRADGQTTRFSLIDGGVFDNNPAMSGYVEAQKFAEDARRRGEELDIMVVSLGTGDSSRPFRHEDTTGWGAIDWINPAKGAPILDVMMNGQAKAADHHLDYLLGDRYWRFDRKLTPEDANPSMDDADPENVAKLKAFAETVVQENSARIDQLCRLLGAPSLPQPHRTPDRLAAADAAPARATAEAMPLPDLPRRPRPGGVRIG